MRVSRLSSSLVFGWLLVSVALGLLLRASMVFPLPWMQFRYVLHAHTHLALLGWVFGGFFLLLCGRFAEESQRGRVRWLFWGQQAALVGMLCTFPFQGYAAASIVFSTLFLLIAFWFALWLWRRLAESRDAAALLLRIALVFLCVSQLGPLALGYFMAKDMGHTHWYPNSVYYYLHFLYNGFFTCALAALALESWARRIGRSGARRLEIWVFAIAVILGFAGSLLWMRPVGLVYGLAIAGAALQLGLLGLWTGRFWRERSAWREAPWTVGAGTLVAVALLIKSAMQLAGAFAPVAAWAYASAPFTVIGYIHFIMLGVFTPYLLASLFPLASWSRAAWLSIGLYALGFLWTEGLLFGQGVWPGLAGAVPLFASLFWGYVVLAAGLCGFGATAVWGRRR